MSGTTLPDDMRRFLLGAIPSVPHLEALLLMQADAGIWTAACLGRRLYVDEAMAVQVLADLIAQGLLRETAGGFHFAPRDRVVASLVADLAGVYARQVVAVTELIHSMSDRKARCFANAFRLRKES